MIFPRIGAGVGDWRVVLILVMFRSVLPLLLSLLSIAIGALSGTVFTLLGIWRNSPDDAGAEHQHCRDLR